MTLDDLDQVLDPLAAWIRELPEPLREPAIQRVAEHLAARMALDACNKPSSLSRLFPHTDVPEGLELDGDGPATIPGR